MKIDCEFCNTIGKEKYCIDTEYLGDPWRIEHNAKNGACLGDFPGTTEKCREMMREIFYYHLKP